MELPRFLGNRVAIPPGAPLPPEVASFRNTECYGRDDLEVYGHTFYGITAIPPSEQLFNAFEFQPVRFCLNPQCVVISTDQRIIVRIVCGATISSEHTLLPGITTIEFSHFYVQPYVRFHLDVRNLGQQEANVSCQLVCHIYCRRGDMAWDSSFTVPHIETPEERAAREERVRIAHAQRIEREARAWVELEGVIGIEAATFLKENHDGWYSFTGSNQELYAVSGEGTLANISQGKRYCLQLVGVDPALPIPDIIMEKITWCRLDAGEVERKANKVGEFHSGKIYREVAETLSS